MHGAPRSAFRTRGRYCQQDYVAEDIGNGKSRSCTAVVALKILALATRTALLNTAHLDSVGDILAEREATTLAPQEANSWFRGLNPNCGVSRSCKRCNPSRRKSLEEDQGLDARIGTDRKIDSCGVLEKLRRTPRMGCDSEQPRTVG